MTAKVFWPHILMTVKDALSEPDALRLAAACGGQRRAIPDKAKGSALEKEVGADIARVLTDAFAQTTIYIPRGPQASLVARDRREQVAQSPNSSANQLAQKLQCSARRIEQIRRDLRGAPDPNQPKMV